MSDQEVAMKTSATCEILQDAVQMQRDRVTHFVTHNKKVTFNLTQGHLYSCHSIGLT